MCNGAFYHKNIVIYSYNLTSTLLQEITGGMNLQYRCSCNLTSTLLQAITKGRNLQYGVWSKEFASNLIHIFQKNNINFDHLKI